MAYYPIIHKETGEQKVIECSVHDIIEWYENNPEWERDWSQGGATIAKNGVGEWKTQLANKHSGWKHILDKVKNTPKSQAKDVY
ncbi:hypothetical protein [Synechococcus phage S-N03]|uniref:Uncharacterized protein n=1 Tax=Synechococcus phage S-N03 TaxID=2718943 RepID=A0A6G8R5Z8_9CAUD|nr:transcriptional regulator [Synechococcus phage S-N03]QIN96804.1 hypothetical protein [Synechococcus phage S-N03]